MTDQIQEFVNRLVIENKGVNSLLEESFFTNLPRFIDYLTKIKHGFNISSAMTDAFKGPNIITNSTLYKPNTNQSGYVFTTRPDLNLSSVNIKIERRFMPLLTDNEMSVMRAIRLILSPRMAMKIPMVEYSGSLTGQSDLIRNPNNPLINPQYPFIAISDNNVKSLTGWPSGGGLGIHSTPAGILKEVHIMADSPNNYNTEFSLNLSLNSMQGSPTLYLYYFWILYIGCVLSQTYGMMPWPEYLGNGRLDYTCRHYRLIMDETRTYVNEIGMTGYSIPRNIDIGPIFDYQAENPRPYVDRSIDVEFACSGAIYLDDLVIKQFNETVQMFKPEMHKSKRQQYMVKVEKKWHKIFNNQCYPWINIFTRELEWWVEKRFIQANRDLIIYASLTDSII